MDRRKAEAQCQLQKLKEECEITLELLNKLILTSSKHVNELDKLDSRDFRLHSKYFLAVSQFQYLSHQKLLELNVEVEEHLLENNPPSLEHFKLVCATKTSVSAVSLRESECNVPSPTSSVGSEPAPSIEDKNISQSTVNSTLPSKVGSDSDTTFLSLKSNDNDNSQNSFQECLSSITLLAGNSSVNSENESVKQDDKCEAFIAPKLSLRCPSTSTLLDVVNTKKYNSDELDESTSSEYLYCVSSQNESKSQASRDRTKSEDSFFSDASFYEDPEPSDHSSQQNTGSDAIKPIKISDKLKLLPMMSLEEKFLKSLPKAPMPDLALKPTQQKTTSKASSKSSVGSDIVSESTVVEQRKKKLRKSRRENQIHKTTPADYRKFEIKVANIENHAAPKVGDYCMIGFMKDPTEFYIQVADDNSTLLDLWSDQLGVIYGNSQSRFSSKTEAMDAIGNFCCIQEEGYWYRAEILDWKMDAAGDERDMVHVQLIDYGNEDIVSYNQLRPLIQGFCHVPKMAQLCHLPYLYPPGSKENQRLKEWPKESLDGFYDVFGNLNTSHFQITHVYACEGRKSLEVDIVGVYDEGEGETIGQILVDKGLAVEIFDDMSTVVLNHVMIDQIRKAHGMQGIRSEMSKEEILDRYFQQNVDVEAANINEAVMHYNPRDEAETCRNLRSDGTCYKGSRCKLRHVPLRDGFTRDREMVYQEAFVDAPLPRIDEEILLTISHILDIQCFYAQVRHEGNQHSFVPTINSLIKTMNSPDMVKLYRKLKYPPCLNQLVIAKHWNTYWYRAQVRSVQIPENNDEVMVEVYVVDFGDKLQVPMSQLREILPDFLHIHFQAVECRLFNIKHRQGLDEAEERRYFESRYLGETLRAKIVATPGHLEVLLKSSRNEDIGLQLIEDGYGELNTEHHFPAENEIILID